MEKIELSTFGTQHEQHYPEGSKELEVFKFVTCGDLSGFAPPGVVLDADKSYPMDSKDYIAPIAPPIDPPYETSIAREKEARQKKATS